MLTQISTPAGTLYPQMPKFLGINHKKRDKNTIPPDYSKIIFRSLVVIFYSINLAIYQNTIDNPLVYITVELMHKRIAISSIVISLAIIGNECMFLCTQNKTQKQNIYKRCKMFEIYMLLSISLSILGIYEMFDSITHKNKSGYSDESICAFKFCHPLEILFINVSMIALIPNKILHSIIELIFYALVALGIQIYQLKRD